jgi:dTDP-4-dehydrorhamnose 3,5-epimerase
MELKELELPGAYLLNPKRFRDARGFFVESYNKKTLAARGLNFDFIQDNASLSAKAGTVRGLHFQSPPSEQTKLVSVLTGAVLDVLVDIRNGSPTYGRHVAVELTAENGLQTLVPRGFAHGFCTLADDTLVQYKVDAHYDPARDLGLLWNDPDLGIVWPVTSETAVLIDKDKKHPRLRDLPRHFAWTEKA